MITLTEAFNYDTTNIKSKKVEKIKNIEHLYLYVSKKNKEKKFYYVKYYKGFKIEKSICKADKKIVNPNKIKKIVKEIDNSILTIKHTPQIKVKIQEIIENYFPHNVSRKKKKSGKISTFESLFERFLEQSDYTEKKGYDDKIRNYIKPFLYRYDISAINKKVIKEFYIYIRDKKLDYNTKKNGDRINTLKKTKQILNKFFSWLTTENYEYVNPFKDDADVIFVVFEKKTKQAAKNYKIKNFTNVLQLRLLFNVIYFNKVPGGYKIENNVRNFILFTLITAQRFKTIANLKYNNIHEIRGNNGDVIKYIISYDNKTKEQFRIPLPPCLQYIIDEQKEFNGSEDDDYIFKNAYKTNKINCNYVNKTLKKVCNIIGIDEVTTHSARKAMRTYGKNIKTLNTITGCYHTFTGEPEYDDDGNIIPSDNQPDLKLTKAYIITLIEVQLQHRLPAEIERIYDTEDLLFDRYKFTDAYFQFLYTFSVAHNMFIVLIEEEEKTNKYAFINFLKEELQKDMKYIYSSVE